MKLNEIIRRRAPEIVAQFDVEELAKRNRTEKKERVAAAKGRDNDLVDVAKDYKNNLKTILDKRLYFFRNSDTHSEMKMDKSSDLLWVEQKMRAEPRGSQYADGNVLLRWVDAKWKDFPKRAMSYFATQNLAHARNFGADNEVMLIIPKDDVKKFAYMGHDFNLGSSMNSSYTHSVEKFFKEIRPLFLYADSSLLQKIKTDAFGDLNFEHSLKDQDLFKVIAGLDSLIDNARLYKRAIKKVSERQLFNLVDSYRDELRENGFSSIEEMMNTITPSSHGGVQIVSDLDDIESEKARLHEKDELWFEGDYLGVYWNSDTAENLRALLKKL